MVNYEVVSRQIYKQSRRIRISKTIGTICSTGSRPGSEHDLTELGRTRPDSQDAVETIAGNFPEFFNSAKCEACPGEKEGGHEDD